MPFTRDDVLAAVRASFADSDSATILALLDSYGTEPHEREKERVQVAMIELSAGSKQKLIYMIDIAKKDYRDVLAWKELGPLSKADGEKLQNDARSLIERWGEKR